MDLQEKITLSSNGKKIELPLINLLRLTIYHLYSLIPEYYAENKSDSLKDFLKWVKKKLGMEGKGLLL